MLCRQKIDLRVNCFEAARDAFPVAANPVNPSPGLIGHNIACTVAEAQKVLTFLLSKCDGRDFDNINRVAGQIERRYVDLTCLEFN